MTGNPHAEAAAQAARILDALASALRAGQGSRTYRSLIDEVTVLYGETAAAHIKAFLAEIVKSEIDVHHTLQERDLP